MLASKFILDILDLLLDGDEYGKALRPQIDYLEVQEYEYTGSGVFITFRASGEILTHKFGCKELRLDGVSIRSTELEIGAAAIVFVHDGLVRVLEIWSYGRGYPKKELASYMLKQQWTQGSDRWIYRSGSGDEPGVD